MALNRIIARNFQDAHIPDTGKYTGFQSFDWKKDAHEHTGAQSLYVPVFSDGTITNREIQIPYPKRREMLKHPVIAMARQLAVAPMALADWSIRTYPETPKSAYWLISHEIMRRKVQIIERAFKDCIDFGFCCFEVVWDPDGKDEAHEDAVTIKKFKHLFPYSTFLRANPKNGDFAGILQYDLYDGQPVYLPRQNVQLFNIDVEGTNHYGNSMLDNCVKSFDNWTQTRMISMGYLKKIAGAHWVVYYPDGETEYDGKMLPNFEIANLLLRQLEANGGMAIPQDVAGFIHDQSQRSDRRMWEVEQISDSGASSASYIEQLKYDDDQMVMGLMFPPNALLEGHYGTKAEAVAHAEAAIASMELMSDRFARLMSEQTVNQLLEFNYGKLARDSAYLEVAPITDNNKEILKEIYLNLLSNPDSAYSLIEDLNVKGIADKLKVSKL